MTERAEWERLIENACPCRRSGDPGCVRDEVVTLCTCAPYKFTEGLLRIKCRWSGHGVRAAVQRAILMREVLTRREDSWAIVRRIGFAQGVKWRALAHEMNTRAAATEARARKEGD